MSTIREIIARVDDVKINAFGEEVKMAWIAELDGKIALDVMLMSIDDVQQLQYKHPDDLESTPLVKFPHDSLYDLWLGAKIDFANGEYSKYQNSMEMFNAHYGNYVRWFAQFYEPAQGYARDCRCYNNPPYYISAYSLAISRGFEGTLDQWLASLVGKKVAIRYDGEKILWRWCREGSEAADPEDGEEWTELIDVEELRGMRPFIGENGNWWIGEKDLGVQAAGNDGKTPINGEDYFTEEDIAKLKEFYIPVGEQNFGSNNEVGLKGYYFTAVDFAESKFTLSMKWDVTDTEGLELAWSVGDVISIKNDNWYGYCATITAIEGNVITVDAIPFEAIGANLDYDNHVVVVPEKPLSGQVELCRYAASFGYKSGVYTKGGFNAGGNNYIGPSAGNSATIGSELKNTASNAVAVNYKNEVHADNSFVGGMGNIIHRMLGSGTNFVFGYLQQLWGNFCAMFGYNNKIVKNPTSTPAGTIVAGRFLNARGSGQLVCGEHNLDDGTEAYQGGLDQNSYFVVGGGTASKRKTVFRVRRTGNTDICGNKVTNMAAGTDGTDAVNVKQMGEAISTATAALPTTEKMNAAINKAVSGISTGTVGMKRLADLPLNVSGDTETINYPSAKIFVCTVSVNTWTYSIVVDWRALRSLTNDTAHYMVGDSAKLIVTINTDNTTSFTMSSGGTLKHIGAYE